MTKYYLMKNIKKIAEKFEISGQVTALSPYGNGHINDTFLVETNDRKYILQKLNIQVFKNYREVIENIAQVLNFLKNKGLDVKLDFINTKDNGNFLETNNACYRMYNFIENSVALDNTDDPKVMESIGRLNATFIRDLDGIDSKLIQETIPNFHHTARRYQAFLQSIKSAPKERLKKAQKEVDFVINHAKLANQIVDLLDNGELPLRIIHNDTKINNMLLDKDSLEAVCAIDLDTIMPGTLLYDFGDAVRYGCNSAKEDEEDLTKVYIKQDIYQAYIQGFVQGMGTNLTPKEKSLLHTGAKVITYECGMRFLTDYLEGDRYFKIKKPDHNLIRARNQFKLLQSLEQLDDTIANFVQNLST